MFIHASLWRYCQFLWLAQKEIEAAKIFRNQQRMQSFICDGKMKSYGKQHEKLFQLDTSEEDKIMPDPWIKLPPWFLLQKRSTQQTLSRKLIRVSNSTAKGAWYDVIRVASVEKKSKVLGFWPAFPGPLSWYGLCLLRPSGEALDFSAVLGNLAPIGVRS